MSKSMHLSLFSSDLKTSVSFYEKFLGAAPVKQRPGYAKFVLSDPPLNLALNESAKARQPGISHVGIEVTESSAVWESRKMVEAAGLPTRTEENVDCCYAVQDKFWVSDPDGLAWEVFTVKDDAGVTEAAGACCDTGCCA